MFSDIKSKKNGLLQEGLKLHQLNYEVDEVIEAAARGLDDRIREGTLVIYIFLRFVRCSERWHLGRIVTSYEAQLFLNYFLTISSCV